MTQPKPRPKPKPKRPRPNPHYTSAQVSLQEASTWLRAAIIALEEEDTHFSLALAKHLKQSSSKIAKIHEVIEDRKNRNHNTHTEDDNA